METKRPWRGEGPLRYPIPAGASRIEFEEKRSIFIGSAGPASSVADAEAFTADIAALFRDASHNAWAYLIGFGRDAACACHNDGEPGGTAGPPALAALQGSGIGDVVVVVTRYFGGIKLGTGGLARAYGRAAREALAALSVGEKVARAGLSIVIGYHHHDALRRLFPAFEVEVLTVDYTDRVRFTVDVPVDCAEGLLREINEATAGGALVEHLPQGG